MRVNAQNVGRAVLDAKVGEPGGLAGHEAQPAAGLGFGGSLEERPECTLGRRFCAHHPVDGLGVRRTSHVEGVLIEKKDLDGDRVGWVRRR